MSTDDRFTVEEPFAFLGRTFEEYCAMFDVDEHSLRDRSILDCPGGPGSFTAIASQLGADVTAVDPAYEADLAELTERCESSIERSIAQLAEKTDQFVWDYYGDVATRERYLRAAARRFLADRSANPVRYVPAALPDLPLPSDAVDLALSGNLLFLYDDRLDEEFHVAALRELARVAREEVRVFTIAALDGNRSDLVAPVVERLRADGLTVSFREVPYEFQPGATEMLAVSPS